MHRSTLAGRYLLATLATLLFAATAANAQTDLSPATRKSVVDSTIAQITKQYVDPDTAKLIAKVIRTRASAGAYDSVVNPARLADLITHDLQSVNGDLHTALHYVPPVKDVASMGLPPDARLYNYGLGKAEILEGNVGLLEITGFVGGAYYREAANDALTFLSRTDALIIDLRQNGGGALEMSHFILSHFLTAKEVPLADVHLRGARDPMRRMSIVDVPGPRRPNVPVFILTSENTASASEEFALALKSYGRAKTVGTVTAGAGHVVAGFDASNGFIVSISIGRVTNPVTGKEWERVGVPPDIEVDPERAPDAAHAAALNAIKASTTDARRIKMLTAYADVASARAKATPEEQSAIAPFAGSYEGRVITARDGWLWYSRNTRTLAERLVHIEGTSYALGSVRMHFADGTLSIEQLNGSTLTLKRD